MKSTIFTKVIDKTTLEVNESFKDTIDKLRAQQGVCRETDTEGNKLEFSCSKRGKLMVSNTREYGSSSRSANNRMYYVYGKVIRDDEKTKVAIYTVHDRTVIYSRYFSIIFDFLYLIFTVIMLFLYKAAIKEIILMFLAVVTLSIFPIVFSSRLEQKYKEKDIEIMKNEIIKRVEAIKRWDD